MRAERTTVEVVQAEVRGPFERVQIVVDGRAVERVQAAVGVGDEHALAELVEHGLQEHALLLERAAQRALLGDVAQDDRDVRDLAALGERQHVQPEARAVA